jgi:hypothetical protein
MQLQRISGLSTNINTSMLREHRVYRTLVVDTFDFELIFVIELCFVMSMLCRTMELTVLYSSIENLTRTFSVILKRICNTKKTLAEFNYLCLFHQEIRS